MKIMPSGYIKTTGYFKSANGISEIAYYMYSPRTAPRAAVQIVHGMSEFIERYEEFAAFLCANSIAVFGCDHIGHGRSVASEEDKGYFYTNKGWQDMISDCYTMSKIGRKIYSGIPYILFGHSMGSFVARAAMVKFGSQIDLTILSGTGAGLAFSTSQETMVGAIEASRGGRYRSTFLNDLAFGRYNSHIEAPVTKSDWLTRDHDKVIEFLSDPKYVSIFTVNGFLNLIKLYTYVNREEWYKSIRLDKPILLISGDEDPVGGWGKGVKSVYDKLAAYGCNAELRLYAGGRHELLNEINRQEVFYDILAAIKKYTFIGI